MLTVILPAYNEELRIAETITKYGNYLAESNIWGRDNGKWCNILVVDDGSTDKTLDVVKQCNIRVEGIEISAVSLEQNEGKGSAVARGMMAVEEMRQDAENASGWVILVADADGSGDMVYLNAMIYEFSKLVERTAERNTSNITPWRTKAMLVGNRDNASLSRIITRWGFKTLVKIICGDLQVDDTQCGFKLMTLDAGLMLYSNLNLKRWTHDVEVLYRAKKMMVPVTELKIGWEDKAGSKLATTVGETVRMSAIMLFETLTLTYHYKIGQWKLPDAERDIM